MNPPSEARPAVDWALVAPAYGSLLLFGLSDNVRGPILPDLIEDLRLSDAQAGLVFSATSLGVAAGSLGVRGAVRRWGAIVVQQAGLLVLAVGLAGMAAAPGLGVLLGAALVMGLGMGSQAVTHNLLVTDGARADARRRALNGLHAMYGLASLAAPLVVTALYGGGLSWRGCLWAFAAAPLVLFAASLRAPRGPRAAPAAGAAGLGGRGAAVAAVAALYVVAELLLSTRLVLLLRREGWAQDAAALALSGFFLALLVGRVALGTVRVGLPSRQLLIGCAAAALGLFAAGLAWAPGLLPLVALPMAPFFPTLMELVAEEFPAHVDALLGVIFAAVSLTLVGAHYAVGLLSDATSLRLALATGPLALVGVLGLLGTALPGRAPR